MNKIRKEKLLKRKFTLYTLFFCKNIHFTLFSFGRIITRWRQINGSYMDRYTFSLPISKQSSEIRLTVYVRTQWYRMVSV